MKFIWELNALVNETHEGRCLSRQFCKRGGDFLNMLDAMEISEEQKVFLKGELDLALPRLKEGASMMNGIIETLEKAKRKV